MSNIDFIHLRVRSSYSLLESSLHMEELTDLCIHNTMPAIGISDNNNLFGALEFSELMVKSGIQPIIGTTINLHASLDNNANLAQEISNSSVCLIATNEIGYSNLMRLSSLSYQKSNFITPYITFDELFQYNDGVIILTGGEKGLINKLIHENNHTVASEHLIKLKKIFSDRLYIEIQRSNSQNEDYTETALIDFAYDMNIPLVATNNVLFASKEDHEANDILQCILSSDVISNPNRNFASEEGYFKSQQEMVQLFRDIPEAIANTLLIAQRCSYRPLTLDPVLPKYSSDANNNENEILSEMAIAGLESRLSKYGVADGFTNLEYKERLREELSIVLDMNYAGYFLIVADIINWSKDNSIPVGPGRGSGAGSLVAWSIGITDLDPIKFNLVFERFLNPHRVSMPDFDIDFCPIRRDEVINYIKERYGKERVAQIITFGKLQARAVIRDVGRVLEMPYSQVDNICRLIPNNPANPMNLTEAITGIKELRILKETDETISKLLTFSLSLEGLYRHASTHAAGVVISEKELTEYVPIYMDQKTNMPVTQFNMKWAEQAGLVKFDILGLKTLSVISECCKQLNNIGISVDISAIKLEDQKTIDLFREGQTSGVFQFESSGMKDLLIKAQPSNFEDLIALIALFRPGPMENIPQYLNSKNSNTEIEVLHDLITPIIADTYGVIIYQEQVIQIAQRLANYSLGEADILRRAMGKKIKSEMDAQRNNFIIGASDNGVSKEKAEYIFDLVDKFAGYGFNKAHSAAYALIAFQTAYLKANHPLAFISALLTLDIGNIDKVSNIISEAKRMKIDILPPSINQSMDDFKIEGKGIRFSLAAIRNVGAQAVKHICDERHANGVFQSMYDFISRIDPHYLNKRSLESLIMSGSFDEFEENRALLFSNIDMFLSEAIRIHKKNIHGQIDIFQESQSENQAFNLIGNSDWSQIEKLNREYEVIGTYLSGHPIEDYSQTLIANKVINFDEFVSNVKNKKHKQARLAGVIQNRINRRGKNGRTYSFIKLSDQSQDFEALMFSDVVERYNDLIFIGNTVILKVDAELQEDVVRIKVNEVMQANITQKEIEDPVHIDNLKENQVLESDFIEGQNLRTDLNKYKIKVPNLDVLENIALKLKLGSGRDMVNIIFYDKNLKKDIELEIGDTFNFDKDIKDYLSSIPGVELLF